MAAKLRLGIIGIGSVGRIHLETSAGLNAVTLAAVADINPTHLQTAANSRRVEIYQDYVEMIKNERLDMVSVCTPAASHRDIVITCAQHGLHVLCEKPLAVTVADAKAMTAACQKAGVKLFYGASYRYLPAIIKARELISSGAIGDVLILREQEVGGNGPEMLKRKGFEHYPSGGPGGSDMGLMDHGIHLVDTFCWLMNTPVTSVIGRGNISGEKPGTEYALMVFANGAHGQLLYNDGTYATDLPQEGIFSWGSGWDHSGYYPPGQWCTHPGCIHVHGTKGALRIFHYANALFLITAQGVEQIKLDDQAAPHHFARQMEAFAANIRAGTPAETPASDGLHALTVIEGIYKSQKSGQVSPLTLP